MSFWPDAQQTTQVIRLWQPDPAMFRSQELLPINSTNWNNSPDFISWDILGTLQGMTYAHALGTDPRLTTKRVLKTKSMPSAYWKDSGRLNEQDILKVRDLGENWAQRAAEQLVVYLMEQQDLRVDIRIEYLNWLALTTGLLQVNEVAANGVPININVDYEVPAANKVDLTNNPAVGPDGYVWGPAWSDATNSVPIQDLQTARLLFRGTGAKPWRVYMSGGTAGLLTKNGEIRNLLKQQYNVDRQLGIDQIPSTLSTMLGIPGLEIVIYDEVWFDEAGNMNLFIPFGKLVFMGRSMSPKFGPFGYFASTPSLHNGGIARATGGKFTVVKDRTADEENPWYNITTGIYGLPVMYHPNWLVIMTVA